MLARGEPPIEPAPPFEAVEITLPDGTRVRYVRAEAPSLPALEAPATQEQETGTPRWAWVALAALPPWLVFLLHAWRFSAWWTPVGDVVRVVWVVGWLGTVVGVAALILGGFARAFRQ